MALETKQVITIETNQAAVSLKSLRDEIKLAKEQMLNAAEGSKEYSNALQLAADKSFALREIQQKIRGTAADLGEMLANGTKVLGGLASGFAAAQGAMTLFGGESEDLQKALLKVQAAMALMAGLEGLEGLGKNVSNLITQLKQLGPVQKTITTLQILWNNAIKANPIVAAISLIIAFGGAIYGLTKIFEDDTEAIKRNNTASDGLLFATKELKEAHEEYLEVLKDAQVEYDIITGKITEYDKKVIDLEKNYKKAITSIADETREKLEDTGGFFDNFWSRAFATPTMDKEGKLVTSYEKELAEETKNIREEGIKKMVAERLKVILGERNLRKQEELDKKKEEEKIQKDKEKEQDRINKQYLSKVKETKEKELEILRQANSIEQKYVREVELSKMSARDAEVAQIQDKYAKEIELLEQQKVSTVAIRESMAQEILNVQKKYDEIELAAKQEKQNKDASFLQNQIDNYNASQEELAQIYEKDAEEYNRIQESKKQATQNTFTIIGNLAELFQSKNEAKNKKLFQIQKIADAASATISTYRGAASAFAETPGGVIIKSIAAAAAVTSGLLNVKKILSQKFESSTSTSSTNTNVESRSANNNNNNNNIQPPRIQQSIVPTRNILNPSESNLMNEPIKAYVVESEITGVQKRVNKVVEESTF